MADRRDMVLEIDRQLTAMIRLADDLGDSLLAALLCDAQTRLTTAHADFLP